MQVIPEELTEKAPRAGPPKRILFIVTEDWYFASHRLAFAKALVDQGHEVAIACNIDKDRHLLDEANLRVYPVPFGRHSFSPIRLTKVSWMVRQVIREFKPDLIHNVALLPILIGNLVSVGTGVPRVNAIAGMGSTFTSKSLKFRVIGVVLKRLLGWGLRRKNGRTVFQNQDDREFWIKEWNLPREETLLVRGAGVDCNGTSLTPEPVTGRKVVMFAGRLLVAKGIVNLVEASAILRTKSVDHTLRIVGDIDPWSSNSVTAEWITEVAQQEGVEWLGHRKDVVQQMKEAHIVVLPSFYGEGLPKVLLEAGIAGRAVVTTDMVGCREVVIHEKNGLLVPPQDPKALSEALERLLTDDALRQKLAACHYRRVKEEFSTEKVFSEFFEIYSELLSSNS